MIKSVKGVEKMMGMLKQISTTPSPKMDQLETQIYYAFGTSGNLKCRRKNSRTDPSRNIGEKRIEKVVGSLSEGSSQR